MRLYYIASISEKSLGKPSHFCNICHDEVVIARLFIFGVGGGGGGGGEGSGFPILKMQLGIVSKIPCQRIVVLTDPGVQRTFVEDCISCEYKAT